MERIRQAPSWVTDFIALEEEVTAKQVIESLQKSISGC